MPTVTVTTFEDTYLAGSSTTFNFGASTGAWVGNNASNNHFRSLYKPDLSFLPVGSIIQSATLSLYCTSVGSSTSRNVSVHRSLVQWFEGARNGGAPLVGENASTWNHRNANGSVAWAGGVGGGSGSDWEATAIDTTAVAGTGVRYTWDIAAFVQGVVDGDYTNHGLWVLGEIVGGVNTVKIFGTEEIGSTQRPELEITYVVPLIVGSSSGTGTPTGTISNGSTNAVVEIQPDSSTGKDTRITSQIPTSNFGSENILTSGHNSGTTYLTKTLIEFDLSPYEGEKIVSATLSLYCVFEHSTVDQSFTIRRGLVEWFEGSKNNAVPDPGEDASTWNFRNANGSVAWLGGAGGVSGTDYLSSGEATDTVQITEINKYYIFDVTTDVQGFVDNSFNNYGWWILPTTTTSNSQKQFASSEHETAIWRPKLTIVYIASRMIGSSAGQSTHQANIVGKIEITGNIAGESQVQGLLLTNEYIHTNTAGFSQVIASIHASGYLRSSLNISINVSGTVHAEGRLTGTTSTIGVPIADIKGIFNLSGSVSGTSSSGAFANFQGRLRTSVSGVASVIGLLWGKATGVAAVIGCNSLPFLYITDGSVRPNGQLNLLNFLSEGSGFKLRSWRPKVSQYKEGGRFSNGPLAQGRRLRYRNFDNVIEDFELAAVGQDQDALIEFQQELMGWQEAAADYWISDFVVNPVYLVAKAARELHERYAIIHMISVPELENPYIEPFFGRQNSVFDTIVVHIERGHWLSTPPGQFECVPISSVRSWTVSGWESGS